jgi:hypothetical protein
MSGWQVINRVAVERMEIGKEIRKLLGKSKIGSWSLR